MTKHGCPYENDWSLLSLGTLEPGDRERLLRHLESGCPVCLSLQQEWDEVVSSLAYAAPAVCPSHSVEKRLEAWLENQPWAPIATAPFQDGPPPVWSRWVLVANAAALAAAMVLVLLGVHQLNEIKRAFNESQREISSLRGTLAQLRTAPVPKPSEPKPLEPPRARSSDPARVVHLPPPPLAPVSKPETVEVPSAADRQRIAELAGLNARLKAEVAQVRQEKDSQVAEDSARMREANAELARLTKQVEQLQEASTGKSPNRDAYDQLLALLGSGPARSVNLTAVDPAAGNASARAVLTGNGGLVLIADRLPQLPPGKCYQLWLIRKANPSIVSGGIFQIDGGRATLIDPHVQNPRDITGFAITDEPAGGSVSARGHKLLFGVL